MPFLGTVFWGPHLNKFAIVAFATVLSTSTVFAADLGVTNWSPTSSTSDAFDWTGFYAGFNLGYGWTDIRAGNLPPLLGDTKGVLGGAQIGYNYDFGNFVLGVEGDVQASGMTFRENFLGTDLDYNVNAFGTVRARAGVTIDRFLPYITGGLAIANGNIKGPAIGYDENQTFVGWTIGAGVEAAVAENVTVKVEYLHTDFGNKDFFSGLIPGGLDVNLKSNIVRAGVNFKF